MQEQVTVNRVIERLHALANIEKVKAAPFYLGIKLGPLRSLAIELSISNIEFKDFRYDVHYELNLVLGMTIAYQKKSFDQKLDFFFNYFQHAQDWSYVDSVVVSLPKGEADKINANLQGLITSPFPYVRRFGYVLALVHLVPKHSLKDLFELIDGREEHYHVYMAIAWLLAEIFIRRRPEFDAYIKHADLKIWIRRKMVGKIRDSYRVSNADKQLALSYKMEETP